MMALVLILNIGGSGQLGFVASNVLIAKEPV
jgi:hypothetical protein